MLRILFGIVLGLLTAAGCRSVDRPSEAEDLEVGATDIEVTGDATDPNVETDSAPETDTTNSNDPQKDKPPIEHWSRRYPPFDPQDLLGVWGANSSDVYAVGSNGAALHFDGDSWRELSGLPKVDLLSIWGSGPSDIYVTGGEDNIYHNRYAPIVTHYDGATWSEVEIELEETLYRPPPVWGTGAEEVYLGSRWRYDGDSWSKNDDLVELSSVAVCGETLFAVDSVRRPLVRRQGVWSSLDAPWKSSSEDSMTSVACISNDEAFFALSHDVMNEGPFLGNWESVGLFHYQNGVWSEETAPGGPLPSRRVRKVTGTANRIYAQINGFEHHVFDGEDWSAVPALDGISPSSLWTDGDGTTVMSGPRGALVRVTPDDELYWPNGPVHSPIVALNERAGSVTALTAFSEALVVDELEVFAAKPSKWDEDWVSFSLVHHELDDGTVLMGGGAVPYKAISISETMVAPFLELELARYLAAPVLERFDGEKVERLILSDTDKNCGWVAGIAGSSMKELRVLCGNGRVLVSQNGGWVDAPEPLPYEIGPVDFPTTEACSSQHEYKTFQEDGGDVFFASRQWYCPGEAPFEEGMIFAFSNGSWRKLPVLEDVTPQAAWRDPKTDDLFILGTNRSEPLLQIWKPKDAAWSHVADIPQEDSRCAADLRSFAIKEDWMVTYGNRIYRFDGDALTLKARFDDMCPTAVAISESGAYIVGTKRGAIYQSISD